MSWWIKIDASIDQHPKIIEAGYHGLSVFLLVLRLNGVRKGDGVLPAAYSTPRYLASQLRVPLDVVQEGIDGCTDAGLLVREADGSLRICGWDDDWRPGKDNAERQARHRAKLAAGKREAVTDKSRPVTLLPVTVTDESRPVTSENRENKSRETDQKNDLVGQKPDARPLEEPERPDPEAEKAEEPEAATARAAREASAQIVGRLNELTGSCYEPHAAGNVKLVRARLNDGRRVEDMLAVVEVKVRQWRGDPKMAAFLKPSTLLRPGHFDDYLAEARKKAPISPKRERFDIDIPMRPANGSTPVLEPPRQRDGPRTKEQRGGDLVGGLLARWSGNGGDA